MNRSQNLLSIGIFAEMSRLSIKALRMYDQLHLLQPHHVDPQSGYRYYEADQLPRARMIRNMREMDMPLAMIRQVLAALDSSLTQAEMLVQEYMSMRERQVEQLRAQVRTLIQTIQQETNMSYEVNVKALQAQQVLSLTSRVKVNKLDETIRQTLETLYGMVAEQNIKTGVPFGIYHGAINEQEDGPLEICLPVNRAAQGNGEIQSKQTQGGQAACVMAVGPQTDFPAILGAYDAAADWIQKNGYQMAEPPREVWHSGPGDTPKMEIVWLFK